MPRKYLLQSVTLAPRRENPSVFRRLGICRSNVLTLNRRQPRFRGVVYHFPGTTNPYIIVRLPALKQTNFRLSPVPYRGNVVARVNYSERTLSDHQCHLKTTNSFILQDHLHLSKNHFWKYFSGVDTTPRFSKTFFPELCLSVPILEFLAPLEVFQGLCY
jgi:hypothetical protein